MLLTFIPQNKAVPATKENIAALAVEKERMVKEDASRKDVAQKLASTLPLSVFLAREINQNNVLYGHISAKDILEQLPEIKDKHAVHFRKAIHSYGVHEVEIELHHDVIIRIHVLRFLIPLKMQKSNYKNSNNLRKKKRNQRNLKLCLKMRHPHSNNFAFAQ